MKKKIMKLILFIVMMSFILINIKVNVYAVSDVQEVIEGATRFITEGEASQEGTVNMNELNGTIKFIYSVLLGGGTALAVVAGIYMGVRFMLAASSEEKAEYKKAMIAYVFGIVIIFGGYGIWKVTVSAINNLNIDKVTDEQVQKYINSQKNRYSYLALLYKDEVDQWIAQGETDIIGKLESFVGPPRNELEGINESNAYEYLPDNYKSLIDNGMSKVEEDAKSGKVSSDDIIKGADEDDKNALINNIQLEIDKLNQELASSKTSVQRLERLNEMINSDQEKIKEANVEIVQYDVNGVPTRKACKVVHDDGTEKYYTLNKEEDGVKDKFDSPEDEERVTTFLNLSREVERLSHLKSQAEETLGDEKLEKVNKLRDLEKQKQAIIDKYDKEN